MKKALIILVGVILMAILSGCGTRKYSLNFERGGFSSDKTEYSAGENVTVYFMPATDTDYYFSFEGVDPARDYDMKKGYVFSFVMPDRDVTLSYESRNTMTFDPNAISPEIPDDPEAELPEGFWRCPECKTVNSGRFCSECGHKKPEG